MRSRGKALNRWIKKEPPSLDDGAERRDFIADAIAKYASPSASVLEIGCNAGSNLLALKKRGFSRLAGVDVSLRALQSARHEFTQYHGDLREMFDRLKADGPFDVVFSLAVLMHIHPDDDEIIRRIPELVGQYLITCEWELLGNAYIVPRDYGQMFGDQLEQVHAETGFIVDKITGYHLRVFRRT